MITHSYLRRKKDGCSEVVDIPSHIPKKQHERYLKEKRRRGEDILPERHLGKEVTCGDTKFD